MTMERFSWELFSHFFCAFVLRFFAFFLHFSPQWGGYIIAMGYGLTKGKSFIRLLEWASERASELTETNY